MAVQGTGLSGRNLHPKGLLWSSVHGDDALTNLVGRRLIEHYAGSLVQVDARLNGQDG